MHVTSTLYRSVTLLSSLKASSLKRLAFLIGLNNSGTRTAVLAELQTTLQHPRIPVLDNEENQAAPKHGKEGGRPLRILSIDMGIRNLAYCVLEVQEGTRVGAGGVNELEGASKAAELFNGNEVVTGNEAGKVLKGLKLIAWRRSGVASLASPASSIESTTADPTLPETKEAFDPATFAKLAYRLITSVFLSHQVSHILIERQRYRSGGAPAVLEWTVRVNMFESMLHAVFETLGSQWSVRAQNGENMGSTGREERDDILAALPIFPTVASVNPKKVGAFWLDTGAAPATTKRKSRRGGKLADAAVIDEADPLEDVSLSPKGGKTRIEKEAKIAIAERWLRDGGLVCTGAAEATRVAFLAKREGRTRVSVTASVRAKGKRKGKDQRETLGENGSNVTDGAALVVEGVPVVEVERIGKLDDLADCLLQGVAWVQWEVNRRRILGEVDLGDRGKTRSGVVAQDGEGKGVRVAVKRKPRKRERATVTVENEEEDIPSTRRRGKRAAE